jgi:hypothetical protein
VVLSEKSNGGVLPFPDALVMHLMTFVIGSFESIMHGQSSRLEQFTNVTINTVRGQLNETVNSITYSSVRY